MGNEGKAGLTLKVGDNLNELLFKRVANNTYGTFVF